MIDPKSSLTDGVFCPMPWTGIMYNFDGTVKNCIRSAGSIGNIKDQSIKDILTQGKNLHNQIELLGHRGPNDCSPCRELERGKKNFDIISDRIFYIRELKKVPYSTYNQLGHHSPRAIDIRWSNLCNFACVYCTPEYSSKWSQELRVEHAVPTAEQLENFKSYIFDNVKDLQHVYMAGGEPLLMKENLELLELLKKENPNVNLRINTNLSKVDTRVFETLCQFKNVHWTVSVESMEQEFEYIRYGARWQDFLENLLVLGNLDHKVTFNMLHFLLNPISLFDTIEFFLAQGWHPNSFVAGALLGPGYLDIRHHDQGRLDAVQKRIAKMLDDNPGYLLEDSLKNLSCYIQQDFNKNMTVSLSKIKELDKRRGLDSQQIFPDLYNTKE